MIHRLNIGVIIKIKRVIFQLISHKKIRLPKNCKIFLNSIDMLSEAADWTTDISLAKRLVSYPLLLIS